MRLLRSAAGCTLRHLSRSEDIRMAADNKYFRYYSLLTEKLNGIKYLNRMDKGLLQRILSCIL